jgi:hypothetical protein
MQIRANEVICKCEHLILQQAVALKLRPVDSVVLYVQLRAEPNCILHYVAKKAVLPRKAVVVVNGHLSTLSIIIIAYNSVLVYSL